VTAASRTGHPRPLRQPNWSRWQAPDGRRYTVGAEEEVMLLKADTGLLAQSSDEVLARLPGSLSTRTAPETHASVIECRTGVHVQADAVVRELTAVRVELAEALRAMGLRPACAGTYPAALAEPTRTPHRPRYRQISSSMRYLAHRDPTMALHVHVGVPDPEDAVRVSNALCLYAPLFLALAANSPFCQGRDTGFASARATIFYGFPRTGLPRRFADYADYVHGVDALISTRAVPDPTFLWWDVRLQPALGTVEIRIMDAQSAASETGPLIALAQCLTRRELEDGPFETDVPDEVLAENRFLAARDGLDARLIDPARRQLVPVSALIEELLADCQRHAAALGCSTQLEQIGRMTFTNGADRQRAWARASGGLRSVVRQLSDSFIAAPESKEHPCVAGWPTAVRPSA
jgi:carboxylate-amine ligase